MKRILILSIMLMIIPTLGFCTCTEMGNLISAIHIIKSLDSREHVNKSYVIVNGAKIYFSYLNDKDENNLGFNINCYSGVKGKGLNALSDGVR